MGAPEAGPLLALLAAALQLDLVLVAVADVGLAAEDELLGELVELVEVVAGVGDVAGGEACVWSGMLERDGMYRQGRSEDAPSQRTISSIASK